MKTIFLTGATGTMGFAGLQEILRYPKQYKLRILARASEKNKRLLAPYMNQLEVVWGDLTRYEDVLKGVTGADVVLHVGGMVSPQADYRPAATLRTNISAAVNVRDAVLAQPEDKQPKVVYIGSVAQMGDRREPLHWGRAGDPICVSAYDHYGLTKAMAERIITGSTIKNWVSLRQSGILYPAILKNYDPIMFHVPIRGVLEWATVEDSGRLLERVCREEVPEEFWNRYYNIGSGKEYRISNYEFECLLLGAIGCPKPEKIFASHWFTTRNFHGMWYSDGDKLEEYLHFRANVPIKEYFKQLAHSDSLPAGLKYAVRSKLVYASHLVPHIVKLAMYAMATSKEHGTQWWIKHRKEQRIHAYYGSMEKYKAIPDWKEMDLSHNSEEEMRMNHGYDEQKPLNMLTLEDLQQAAAFRGGKCLGPVEKGKNGQALIDTPMQWQCAEGHEFIATPRLILLGGHWCPECFPFPYDEKAIAGLKKQLAQTDAEGKAISAEERLQVLGSLRERPWQWDKESKRNPFFAQLWAPLHDADEDNIYSSEVFKGWE